VTSAVSDVVVPEVVVMDHVSLWQDDTRIVDDITWRVRADDAWVVLGANGSGKTSLLRLAAFVRGPSSGTVTVLGRTYGACDVREHRRRIGFVSAAELDRFRDTMEANTVVMTGRYGALEPWWHTYDDGDRARANELLELVGCGHVIGRAIGDCSEGERKRVLVARALMAYPELLLLDEPCAGLDLPGREALLDVIDSLVGDREAPSVVLTTHHLEEVPAAATHALLMRGGEIFAAGPLREVLTSERVSEAFGVAVEVVERGGRLSAHTARG
jgi:iron complex transport system ATP-binding protein